MIVYIMRGLPGSGKSTWVKEQFKKHKANNFACGILSADDYHIHNGRYEYKPQNAKEAHDDCYRRFVKFMLSEDGGYANTVIFVDNTNTTLWELAPYYRLAEIYAKEVCIIEMDCPFSVAFQRNVHGVPENTVRQMYQNLLQERLPNHYKRQFIFN